MSVNSKMTAIADEVRTLSGSTDKLSLDIMATKLDDANTEVSTQADLMAQISEALEGKGIPGGGASEDLDEVLTTQEALIDELKTALENKASGGGITPTGTLEITENGEYDVTEYASANVNVESTTEEFVGIKLSDFAGGYELPTVADIRNIPIPDYVKNDSNNSTQHFLAYCFANVNANGNGGYWVNLEEVYIPDGLQIIPINMFAYCAKLKYIHGDFCNIRFITTSGFDNCRSLTNENLPYMPKLNTLSGNSFRNCYGLTYFNFYATATSIHTNAFNGCTNLKDIYVPWSEGAVANAPWGATNATIHYNTTYDENHNPIV